MTPEELQEFLRKCWSRETTDNSLEWSPQNSALGQCISSSLVAYDLLGADIVKGWANIKELCFVSHHTWNCLPDGREIDFTKEQFPPSATFLKSEIIKNPGNIYLYLTKGEIKKYVSLRLAVENQINPNPLFSNENYRLCFEAAQASECQKMKFGCLIVYENKIIASTANKFIRPLRHLCEPKCIRFGIQSRTESMIGACGHAEEWALKKILEMRINPKGCSLYIAGFDAKTNSPWLRKETADFTCLRCAVQLYMAGVEKIFVPFVDHWESLIPEQAVKQSAAYAIKEKKI